MAMSVKDIIRQYLYKKALKDYVHKIDEQCDTYRQWSIKHETGDVAADNGDLSHYQDNCIVFWDSEGVLADGALNSFNELFKENPCLYLAYGHEDILVEDGWENIVRTPSQFIYHNIPAKPVATMPVKAPELTLFNRTKPWFKPCFSPDTLASFNYYGHVFAIKRDFLEQYPENEWKPLLNNTKGPECYRFLLKITKAILNLGDGVSGSFSMNPTDKEMNLGDGVRGSFYTSSTDKEMSLGDGVSGSFSMNLGDVVRGSFFPNKSTNAIGVLDKVLLHLKRELPDIEGDYKDNIIYLLGGGQTPNLSGGQTPNLSGGQTPNLSGGQTPNLSGGQTPDISMVSVIIPSKDNPKVLETCVSSLRNITTRGWLPEIVVVDNGSNDLNKNLIRDLSVKYDFKYIYEPMTFNFSVMCNLGARESKGSYILFLNDDMEIIQPDWLEKMLFTASLPHTGAVGAKLLYPGTDLIQHAGVTNIEVGPVHKLQKLKDSDNHYHGQNHHIYDMMAVTAACLLMKRETFNKIGGYKEVIAVSYNDVELCFNILEHGLYNVYRGDVILYHHESLSRGDDYLSGEKWQRLLEEKDRLYSFHPVFKSYDPYYSRNLASNSNLYVTDNVYDFEKRSLITGISPCKDKHPEAFNHDSLIVNVEHAGSVRRLESTDPKGIYMIEGWSYVFASDNARFSRYLVLTSPEGKQYRVELLDRYREDVVRILPDQVNVAMAGFVARFPTDNLPNGEYSIGLMARDKCSRQRLYRKTDDSVMISN